MATLKLRMGASGRQRPEGCRLPPHHPKVKSVNYLGHLAAGHPRHDLFKRQCLGAGGMISFETVGGQEEAYRFLDGLRLFGWR